MNIVLDAAPLSLISLPRRVEEAEACRAWLVRMQDQGSTIIVPEIADYELRRELLRLGRSKSIALLDQLVTSPAVTYLALTTAAMHLAAEFWAELRRQGKPGADRHALDVDVILCAQVFSERFEPEQTVVATSNPRHFVPFLRAVDWTQM